MTSSRSGESSWVAEEIPLLGFAAIAAACGSGSITAGQEVLALTVVLAFTLFLVMSWGKLTRYGRLRSIILVSTTVFTISSIMALAQVSARADRVESLENATSIQAVVIDDARTFGRRTSVEARFDGQAGAPLILESWKPVELDYGSTYTITGAFEEFGDSSFELSLERKGVLGTFRVSALEEVQQRSILSLVAELRDRTLRAFDDVEDASVLLPALVCRHTTALSDSSLRNDASRTGLSHLLAVSGVTDVPTDE